MNRIMVIDEDKQVRDLLSLILKMAGYKVARAASCQEGLQKHKIFGASVIISDLVLLEDERSEPLRRFFLLSPNLPLITLTGTVSDKTRPPAKPIILQSSHTLQKPFTSDELLATVENVLEARYLPVNDEHFLQSSNIPLVSHN